MLLAGNDARVPDRRVGGESSGRPTDAFSDTLVIIHKNTHTHTHSQDERLGYRDVILSNALQSLCVVLDAMEMMGISFESEAREHDAGVISEVGSYPEVGPTLLPGEVGSWQRCRAEMKG